MHKLVKHFDLRQRRVHAAQNTHSINRLATIFGNLTNLTEAVHADNNLALPALLFQQRGVKKHDRAILIVTESNTKRLMLHGELNRLAISRVKNLDVLATHFKVRTAVVHQSGDESHAAGVDEAAVVVEDVDVGAHVEAFLAGDDAEGFGVEGAGPADGFLQDAREEDFGLVLSGGSVSDVLS